MSALKTNPVIRIHEPLSQHLGGPPETIDFELSLLDCARLSGHLCPTITGAFLMTKAAVEALFPDTKACVRGLLEVELASQADEGVTGPISHVMSYITGAWDHSGFKGLQGGLHSRKYLMRFGSGVCAKGQARFTRVDTRASVVVSYHPERALLENDEEPGGDWLALINLILTTPSTIKIANS